MPKLEIHFVDGRRLPFSRGEIYLTVRKGNTNLWTQIVNGPHVEVPLDRDPGGGAVIASCDGFRECGYFLPIGTQTVHLMLMHKDERFEFEPELEKKLVSEPRAAFGKLLGGGAAVGEQIGELLARGADGERALACLLNVLEAMRWLPNSPAVVGTLRSLELRLRKDVAGGNDDWRGLQQDRVFMVVEPGLDSLLTEPSFRKDFKGAHAGSDAAYKEHGRFGEANLNINLKNHAGNRLADIDLDYYDDKLAHIALEVIPNFVSKIFRMRRQTNPAQVYALRWMATRNYDKPIYPDGVLPDEPSKARPHFDPLFTICAKEEKE